MRQALARPWPEADPSILAPVDEHDALRRALRALLEELSPHEAVRRSAESNLGFSSELWKTLNVQMNVGAIAVPEDRGGLGFGFAELGVVMEECGRALICEPVLTSAVLGVQTLLRAEPSEASELLLGAAISGEILVSVAPLIEDTSVIAAHDRSGWRLTGTLPRVLQGGAADVVIALGRDDDGTRLFAVDLEQRSSRREEQQVLDSTRRQCRIELDAAEAVCLSDVESTPELLEDLGRLATTSLACEHVGVMERMLSLTLGYVAQREQFGRRIGSFQVVKHRLADMLIDVERSRSAARYAATLTTHDQAEAALASAIAGIVAGDAVIRVSHAAIQLHGGIAFTWEHPAHFYLRRALASEFATGGSRRQRASVASLVGV